MDLDSCTNSSNVSSRTAMSPGRLHRVVRRESGRTTLDTENEVVARNRADHQLDVTQWLLQAADDPARARAEWQTMDVALLRCGVQFSAIRVPAHVVFAAARSEDRTGVDDYLEAALFGGPVFLDRQSGRYYCLVRAEPCTPWRVPDTACLVAGSYLGVPHPSIDSSRYLARSFWCVPPDRPQAVCQVDAVAQMVNLGRFRLAAEKEQSGA
ncbi:hypothetical protein ACFY1U_02260 [Streptomyces sp. NPDC001351]|uniref:hypothetical protein n=1 Tax=Streptomyces sp. NPDC001351 TaxID=3364564 RepID=UPI0036BA0BF1